MFPNKMKIDLDTENNRSQLGSVRKFSVDNMVMLKSGFYYFLGGVFILFGLAAIFAKDGAFESQAGNFNQQEAGLLSLTLGCVLIGLCKLAFHVNAKIKQYKPRTNKGDEWES